MENIVLIGADDVRGASFRIRDAATEIAAAAGRMEDALQQQRIFMDDWLLRFEAVLEKLVAIGNR